MAMAAPREANAKANKEAKDTQEDTDTAMTKDLTETKAGREAMLAMAQAPQTPVDGGLGETKNAVELMMEGGTHTRVVGNANNYGAPNGGTPRGTHRISGWEGRVTAASSKARICTVQGGLRYHKWDWT